MSDNKQIKLSFTIDEQSAQRANSVIRELISNVQKLGQAMSGASGSIGGNLLSGANIGGPITNAQALGRSAGKPSGGSSGQSSLTSVFIENGNALKGLANVSRDSMRVMSEGLKKGIADQKRELAGLDQELAKVVKRYDQLGERSRVAISNGMTHDEAAQYFGAKSTNLQSQVAGMAGMRSATAMRLSRMQGFYGELNPEEEGPGPSRTQRFTSWMGKHGIPLHAKGQDGEEGPLARPAVVAATIAAGVMAIASQMHKGDMQYSAEGARRGGIFGGMATSTIGGDLRYMDALQRLKGGEAEDFNSVSSNGWAHNLGARIRAGGKAMGSVLQGNFGAVGDTIHSQQGFSLESGKMEDQAQKIQEKIASDPLYYYHMGKFQQEAGSRVGLMRSMHMGWGKDRVGHDVSGIDSFMTPYTRLGISDQQVDATHSALRNQMGSSGAKRMLNSVIGGQLLGLGGIDTVAAQAGLGGGGSDFMNALFQSGKDKNAAVRIGMLASASDNTPFTDGMGFLGAMQANGPGDMLQARQLGAGASALSGLTTGSMDSYQTGRNTLNAINALPGGSIYAQDYLATKMSPKMMLDIVSGGEMPDALTSRGISREAVNQYWKSTSSSAFDRIIDNGGQGGGDEMDLAKQLKANGGDFKALLGDNPDPKMIRALGSLSEDMGWGKDDASGMGMAYLLAGSGKRAKAGVGMGGDAAAGSPELAASGDREADLREQFKSFTEVNKDYLTALSENAIKYAQVFDGASTNLDKTATSLNESFLALSKTIDSMVLARTGTPVQHNAAAKSSGSPKPTSKTGK